MQIKHLLPYYDITILSEAAPSKSLKEKFAEVQFLPQDILHNDEMYLYLPARYVLKGKFTKKQKLFRGLVYVSKAFNLNRKLIEKLRRKNENQIQDFIDSFDNVVVPSETADWRIFAARLKKTRKIQWIHQCYKCYYAHIKRSTAADGELYKDFSAIVTLSQICRDGFVEIHPHLEDKTVAIRNFAPDVSSAKHENITPLPPPPPNSEYFNIITVMRLAEQKNVFGHLRAASLLKNAGVKFKWYIVGDGPLKTKFVSAVSANSLSDCIVMTGNLDNPYPLLKQCDLFVLFSFYEGTPLTIEEAQLLQVPVIARKIGGIPDQIQDGVTGWLVDGDENDLFAKIHSVINTPNSLREMRENLSAIKTQDEEVILQLRNLFGD